MAEIKFCKQSVKGLGFSGARYSSCSSYFIKRASGLNQKILKAEASWYSEIDERISSVFPSFCGYENIGDETILKLELLDGYVPLSHLQAKSEARSSVYGKAIDFVFDEMHQITKLGENAKVNGLRLVYQQSVNRILSNLSSDRLNKSLTINGEKFPPLRKTLYQIETFIKNDRLNESEPVLCHGDLHAGNIMTDGLDFRLIDPRGEFPCSGKYFPRIYDAGKLLHDIWLSYTNIIKENLIALKESEDEFILISQGSEEFIRFESVLENFNNKFVDSEIKNFQYRLCASLLMLGILPFHKNKPWFETLFIVGLKGLSSTVYEQNKYLKVY